MTERTRRGIVEKKAEPRVEPAKPRRRVTLPSRGSMGDGPNCPDGHGATFILSSGRCYCPDSGHMGLLATAEGGPTPPTRCFWSIDDLL